MWDGTSEELDEWFEKVFPKDKKKRKATNSNVILDIDIEDVEK